MAALVLGRNLIQTSVPALVPALDDWLNRLKTAEYNENLSDYHRVTKGAKPAKMKRQAWFSSVTAINNDP